MIDTKRPICSTSGADRLKVWTPHTALTADVIVLGFGKGGKTAAHVLSDAGQRVVLIEQSEDMYGGTCPNVGCIPTKMLVHYSNSKRLEDAAQEFFANSIEGVRALTTAGRAANFNAIDRKDTATVITGSARFTGPHTVAVGEGKDEITVTASTILINTGSEPIVPDIEGISTSAQLVSSSDLTRLERLPEHLVIIGGGYLGLEFASIYRHFGSDVTVLEATDRLLPKEDDDIASVATRHTLRGRDHYRHRLDGHPSRRHRGRSARQLHEGREHAHDPSRRGPPCNGPEAGHRWVEPRRCGSGDHAAWRGHRR